MKKCVDTSISKFKYMKTIVFGKNCRIKKILEYSYGMEKNLDGDFNLTIGKDTVIVTKNRQPVIVKKWVAIPLEEYVDNNIIVHLKVTETKIVGAYRDSDGWIWEGVVSKSEGNNWFNVREGGADIYGIAFR